MKVELYVKTKGRSKAADMSWLPPRKVRFLSLQSEEDSKALQGWWLCRKTKGDEATKKHYLATGFSDRLHELLVEYKSWCEDTEEDGGMLCN